MGHVDLAYERFSIKGVELTCPFSLIPHNVVPYPYPLLGSGSLRVYRRQPYPIPRPTLIGVNSLYRPYPLSDRLEHYLELPYNHILVYLGRYSPQHSLSEETEPDCIVCRAPPSSVHLCTACT